MSLLEQAKDQAISELYRTVEAVTLSISSSEIADVVLQIRNGIKEKINQFSVPNTRVELVNSDHTIISLNK